MTPDAIGVDSLARHRLAEHVAEELTDWMSEAIEVDERLPSLETLAHQMNVSRTVLRQAIGLLDEAGTIERRGRRWYVAESNGQPERTVDQATSTLEDVEHRSLADRAASAIIGMILEENLGVGDHLPSTKELVDRLGVSVVVVREALSNLAARGLLDRRQGRESTVNLPNYRVLSSTFHLVGYLSGITDAEFHACRVVLESEAVRLAATAPRDEPGRLEEIIERMENSVSMDEYNRNDLALHLEVARLSGNRALELLLQALNGLIREHMSVTYRQIRDTEGPEGIRGSLDIHARLAKAIIDSNPADAATAIEDHFAYLLGS